MNQIDIENHPDFDHHENVVIADTDGLKAIIAVHNTNLGPATGGCRMFPYASMNDALTDVLRLSRGMTYKSALAGLPLGGGKSVIIGNPRTDKTPELLHRMGDFIHSLGGQYVSAEDSGIGVADVAVMAERTPYVSGISNDQFGGDPSPLTALGVFLGIKEAIAYRGHAGLEGIQVAIQGVGNVGYHLARLLCDAGAVVKVADVNEDNLERVVTEMGVETLSIDKVLQAEVDVLAPCALGGAINRDTVTAIRAGIIAGAANNQLSDPDLGGVLVDRGILYAPDYVINAGGIIDVYYQQQGVTSEDVIREHVARIAGTLRRIFETSDLQRLPTNQVADRMAESVFRKDLSAVA